MYMKLITCPMFPDILFAFIIYKCWIWEKENISIHSRLNVILLQSYLHLNYCKLIESPSCIVYCTQQSGAV